MLARILATVGLLTFGIVIPYLEISETHVLNPDWSPHARLHSVWQISTNMSIALVAGWLIWRKGAVSLASVLGLCVMGGVLAAHLLAGRYGGSLTYPGGLELSVAGLHVTLLVPLVATALFAAAMLLHSRTPTES